MESLLSYFQLLLVGRFSFRDDNLLWLIDVLESSDWLEFWHWGHETLSGEISLDIDTTDFVDLVLESSIWNLLNWLL